jgi:polysaccharide pyruvyl transferase WcaK-like protein
MKKLKVLQLASFSGNIGDNANITGTRKHLRNNFKDYELEFSNLEIREFFWKERKYDKSFAEYVNQFDLFIFGGGNFFELWVDYSCNNTSVDIDIPILELIKTPTVFYALGMDPNMGVTEKGISKFKRWLDYVISQDRFLLSLRNDGAYDNAIEHLGQDYAKHFHRVPDGGFFTEVKNFQNIEIPNNKKVIGLNLAGDMLDVRFPMDKQESISYDEFLDGIGSMFNNLFEKKNDIHLVLYPHIYKDLDIISQFMYKIKDKYARNRVTVAPYLHGFSAQDYIFNSYTKCDIIMGNRFHTNVCGIGLNIPTIGFINYPQIYNLYRELDIMDRTVQVNVKGFESVLEDKILTTLSSKSSIKEKYSSIVDDLARQKNDFHMLIHDKFFN